MVTQTTFPALIISAIIIEARTTITKFFAQKYLLI